jgi:hypothetical protein
MTQQDWEALHAAVAAGGGSYLSALQSQQQAALSGVPGGVGGAGTPGTPGASTASTVGADAITAVENQYPDLAWMLNVPDLGSVIVQMAQTGADETAVTAALQSTPWWQTHGDSVRKWIQEVQTDPGQSQADMSAQESSLGATLSQMGFQATGAQLSLLASQSLALGWTDQQIKDNISQNIVTDSKGNMQFKYAGITTGVGAGGSLQSSVQSIQNEAAKYLVPISNSTAQSFATSLAGGHMTLDGVDAYFQNQAASLYPSIAGAIKSGITPADYVTPYKEVAAQLLGVAPDSIDMTQAKWQRPLSTPGPGGTPTAMSLYDWQQTIMKDPQYGYMNSVNAKDRASSIASGLAQVFGKAPTGPAGSTAFNDAGAPSISGVPIN